MGRLARDLKEDTIANGFRLTRPGSLECLPDFRAFLADRCAALPGVTADILFEMQLAVDEACTNIITHGYVDMDPGSIILDLEVKPDRLVVSLTDFGQSFEPDNAPVPDVNAPADEREAGGFGLFFIRQSVDEMSYRVTDNGNIMTLMKHLTR